MAYLLNTLPETWPKILGVDLETTGLDPIVDHILSVAVSDGEQTRIVLHTHDMFDQLYPMLEDASILKLFHNAKFDLKFIERAWGVEVNNIYDSFLAQRVLHNGEKLPASLDQVLASELGIYMVKDTREEFIDHPGFWKRPVTAEQLRYMADDVVHLPKLREAQLRQISKDELGKTLKIELDVVKAFAHMELKGAKLDLPAWEQQMKYFESQIDLSDANLRAILGPSYTVDIERTKKKQKVMVPYSSDEINFNSTSQLRAVLATYGLVLETTRADQLEEELLNDDTPEEVLPILEAILDLRKWKKRLGFKYETFRHPVDGRIYADFHQMGTDTGRASCSKPNRQQVPYATKPDEPNMRHVWVPDGPEYCLLRADYAQQEPRVVAQLSGDHKMIAACNSQDIYVEFGKITYGKTIEKGTEERQIMKQFVLAVGFGAGIKRLHRSSGLPSEECDRIRSLIRASFPVMASYGERMERMMNMYGFVTTASGRRRYFPNMADRKFSEAVNTPVQGTAADMFKIAMAKVHDFLTNEIKRGMIDSNTYIWNIVHDELVIHCAKKDVDYVSEHVKQIMEEAGHSLCPDVLHVAEVQIGDTWDK